MPQRDLLVALLALLALLAWEASSLDLPVARLFGNAAGFAWRDAWLTSRLLHEGGRALAGVLLVLAALDAAWPRLQGPPRRLRAWGVALVALAMALVPQLKHASLTSCPWDLAEFGGVAAYVPHWLLGVADGGPGRCFPSGHAVAGYAFLALYFVWRPWRPALARGLLLTALLLGSAYGALQVLRGAHHVCHVLWSGWLCWVLGALLGRLRPGRGYSAR